MKITTKRLTITVVFAMLVLWLQPLNAQVCTIDLSNTAPAVPADLVNPEPKFSQRQNAAVQSGLCYMFPPKPDDCNRPDYGENYQVGIFARLMSGDPVLQQQAINSLRA